MKADWLSYLDMLVLGEYVYDGEGEATLAGTTGSRVAPRHHITIGLCKILHIENYILKSISQVVRYYNNFGFICDA